MGSSVKTKSSYLYQIEVITSNIANCNSKIATYKARLADPSCRHMKDSYKRWIEDEKARVANYKAEIAVLKQKMKNAPKG
jgi:hypothetical protein